ncbi:MAG: sulfite oxidase-like oxidoreductase [Planctomycetes bacterium]|nr:sulfite oxidase-like oxidoreductase [Planctomycetota bacterium]
MASWSESERKRKEHAVRQQGRLPPGQSLTEKWPVLHHGQVPEVDTAHWEFRVFGLVEAALHLRYDEFRALPAATRTNDIHCVTRWSMFDCTWEGVPAREVLARARPGPTASHALVHAEHGFTANLPLADLLDDSVLFAWSMGGKPLTPEHGWPLRLVVPKLYFWKSVKWVRGLEVLDHDTPGFWERNGYHMRGEPFREQRFTHDP